ncbi:MAG: transposase, partial [Candidatus Methanomethylicaceae archaeon]
MRSVIKAHPLTLLYWSNEELYRRLGRWAEGHFLVRVQERIDWAPLEAACAGFHHSSGPGAPPTHSVPRLVRALVVKYLLNLSLREWEQEIRWNLLVKGFVGYAAFEAGPDHATLERFEQWVMEHQPRAFFDEVLRQIDQDFPEERRKPQAADTYALRAAAASETLIELIRHTLRRLLAALDEVDAEARTQIENQVDQQALFGAEDEVKEFRLDQAERSRRLQTTVIAALQAAELIRSWLPAQQDLTESQRQAVTVWLDSLDKIVADELLITRNAEGAIVSVQELPKKQKGSYRIASATDLDATFRVHGEQIDFGYNVSVAATDTFIREIQADTGSQPDPVAIPDLLQAQQEHHGVLPPKLI